MIEENNIDPVEVFQAFLDSRLENVHTCLPGQIEIYSAAQRQATVKPLVKLKTRDGEDMLMPLIDNVPVMFPGSKLFSVEYDLKKGDGCLLVFAETGIGTWLSGNGIESNSDDVSRFSLTDAICIPGLFPFLGVPIADSFVKFASNILDIKNISSNIILKQDGTIEIKNSSGTITLNATGIVDINGNADFAVAFTDLKTVIDEIQSDITALKNVFSAWTVVAQDGGAALKAAAATWFGTPLVGNIDTAKVDTVKLP
jgi:hypothetical protein